MRTFESQPVAVGDIRRTSHTLAALTFSRGAVALTPRPSSNAKRMRGTWNGVVLGLPRRLPDDRARSTPASTRSRIIARSNSGRPIRLGRDRPNRQTLHAATVSNSRRATPLSKASSPSRLSRSLVPLMPSSQ
jgi:hypothetical protein